MFIQFLSINKINDLNELLDKTEDSKQINKSEQNTNDLLNDGVFRYEKNGKNSNIPHTSRIWTPLDNDNDSYVRNKIGKQSNIKNYLNSNVMDIHESSELNK